MNPQHSQQILYDLALTISGENEPERLTRIMLQRLLYHTGFSYGLVVRIEGSDDAERARLLQAVGARGMQQHIGELIDWPITELHGGNALHFPSLLPERLRQEHKATLHSLRLIAGERLRLFLYTNHLPDHSQHLVSLFEPILVRFARAYDLCERAAQQKNDLEEVIQARTADLKISEERWKFALEGAGDGVWDWNPQTDVAMFSERWKAMLGFAAHEFFDTGAAYFEHVHPEEKDDMLSAVQAYFSGKQTAYSSEFRMRCKDGSWKWILARGMIVSRDANGNPLRMIGTHTDISRRKHAEEIVSESEHRYRTLVENSPFCIHEIDMQGRFMSMNKSGLDMLGQTDESRVCGMPFLSAVSEQDNGRISSLFQNALDGQTCNFEFTTAGPTPLYFRSCFIPLNDAEGKVVKVMGLTEDITESMRAEKALAESHQQMYSLLNSMAEGAYGVDVSGNCTFVNRAFLRILGYEHMDEVIGKHMHELIHHSHADGSFYPASSCKMYSAYQLNQEVHASDEVFWSKQGVAIPVEYWSQPIMVDGVIKGAIATFIDITERKLAEIDLRIAATAFESQEGMFITDANNVILRVNRAFINVTGYSAEEAVGKTPNLLKSGYQDDDFYKRMWASLNDTGTWEGEIWNRRKSGEIFPEHLVITAVKNSDGFITNYVAILNDVTERYQVMDKLRSTARDLEYANARVEEERAQLAKRVAERTAQLLYANKAKDSFLATMSHEIRTPLGGLLGMMEMLNLSVLDENQRQMLQAARTSGKSLLRIVDDILDWSKIEAGKLVLAPQTASISEMLKSVVNTYAQLASSKGIQLWQRVDERLAAIHRFDPLRLAQVLNNFTSNAIKFTEQGFVGVSAEWVTREEGVEIVRFCVKDSGVGIDTEQKTRLFQYYEQASADTARMYGGTGLGLAICRSLAELMGANLSVESTPRAGSVFCITIRLPVVSSTANSGLNLIRDDGVIGKHETDISPLMASGEILSVLAVDDHPVNRMLLRQQLEILGLQVEVAESGMAALARWRADHFDLVITDCHMPEMDGYEFTHNIRETEQQEARPRTTVIAWTANVLAEEEQRCQAAGMDDILTKPTDLSELRAMLAKWLVKK